jgi:hypothetical protein
MWCADTQRSTACSCLREHLLPASPGRRPTPACPEPEAVGAPQDTLQLRSQNNWAGAQETTNSLNSLGSVSEPQFLHS